MENDGSGFKIRKVLVVCISPKMVNSIGLILDVAGVVLIFYFGLPNEVPGEGTKWDYTKDPKIEKRYKRYGKIGLFLLILGFILQFLSDFI